jgi:phage tail sheath protein FI
MALSYVTPGAYYERIDVERAVVRAVRTDVGAFVGIAQRGPVAQPVRVTSYRQFESVFGAQLPDAHLTDAVHAFFENGGLVCHVVRVAAPPAETTAPPGVVQPAGGATSIVLGDAGFVAGAAVTVTRDEPDVDGAARVLAVDAANRRLVWDPAFPLPAGLWPDRPVAITAPSGVVTVTDDAVAPPADGAFSVVRSVAGFDPAQQVAVRQTGRTRRTTVALAGTGGGHLTWATPLPATIVGRSMTFTTGATAASVTLDDEWGEPALAVAAVSPGAWGDTLRVVVRSTSGAQTTSRPGTSRAHTDVVDVGGLRLHDVVRIVQPGLRPVVAYAVVAGVDASNTRVRWSAPLPPTIDARLPMTLDRRGFSLSVYIGARLWQTHADLSLVPDHARYAPAVLAAAATSLVALAPAPGAPALAIPARLVPGDADRWLTGGGDGLAALSARDYVTGVDALEPVDEVGLLAAPDAFARPGPARETVPPCIPEHDLCVDPPLPAPPAPAPPEPVVERLPAFTADDSAAIQQSLIDQCERTRDRFALLDAPPSDDPLADGIATTRAWRKRFDSAFAGLYTPWLLRRDQGRPQRAGGSRLRAVPPSGHVAGLAAALDVAEGPHRAPAGPELHDLQATVLELDDVRHGLLNEEGVNVIRRGSGRGIRVLGARTTSSDPSWRWINVRRLMSAVEESVEHSIQWSVFENHTHELREVLKLAISSYLYGVWQDGALRGQREDEAYFVVCDDTNNPPAAVARGELVIDAGLAIAAPAEFVVFRVGRVLGELRVTEDVS